MFQQKAIKVLHKFKFVRLYKNKCKIIQSIYGSNKGLISI